ncbi:MAG: transposase, partial [Oscillospiraceae bacterium]|nr:transposase [Oscillospiraceae bacterium]
MTLQEAFYKQREELRSTKQELLNTKKRLENARKDTASSETFKKQFSHIKGLNLKISELTRLRDRYKALYEQGKDQYEKLIERFTHLEYENRRLQWEIDCLKGRKTVDGTTAAQEAYAKIEALSNEVARLTAIIERDGTTTGISTSKTPIDKKKVIPNSREKSGRNKGGQPGHEKHTLDPFSDLSDVEHVDHPLEKCPHCGGNDLEEIRDIPKDEVDYEVKVVKKRHHFKECLCKNCGKIVRSKSPFLKAENQYGPVIQALALAELDLGFVSINRTRVLLSNLTDNPLTISDGYLSKLQKRYASLLTDFCEEVRTACISAPLVYWDDTVVFINTVRACMRFYGTENLALYVAHLSKNLAGVLEDNLLPCLPRTAKVMHDHNTINYNARFIFRNVECLQHLERDLQKVFNASGHQWAKQMKELITSTIHKRKQLILAEI